MEPPWKCGQIPPYFHIWSGTPDVLKTGYAREKKEMSWMHVLSALWGVGNLFNG
jgi:hypothetical protein